MNKDILKEWENNKETMKEWLRENSHEINSYKDLFEYICYNILDNIISEYSKIRVMDVDEDYSGTLILMAINENYDCEIYMSMVRYGSCSYCDAIESALSQKNIETKINDLMTLALHIIQNMEKTVLKGE